jgi:3-oxoisoapionate decarboxylase
MVTTQTALHCVKTLCLGFFKSNPITGQKLFFFNAILLASFMQLGISSFTYGWAVGAGDASPTHPMRAPDLLHKAIGFGLKCVQFGDNLPLHELSGHQLAAVLALAQAHEIRIEVGARGLQSKHLERYLDLCTVLGSPLLRFIIDGPGHEPEPDEVVQVLKTVAPELARRHIALGIENHDRFKAKTLANIMDRVGSEQVGICLDCVNSLGAGEGLEQVAEALAHHTINLHIKDYQIERFPHKMGFTVNGRPAGQGMLDLKFLLDKLAPYNRCQTAILELWTPPETDLTLTIDKEERWAKESVDYLTAHYAWPLFSAEGNANHDRV